MATFSVSGIDEIASAFSRTANVPDNIKQNVLTEMGHILMEAQKSEGESKVGRDPNSSVHFIDNITLSKPKLTDDGGYVKVTFKGSRRRGHTETRNAEIAFINEYGKKGQPARPFIRPANEKSAEQAREKGADVLHSWIDNNFK